MAETKSDKAAALIARIGATDDYYKVLQVARDADDDAIKKAYRKAALRLHPDKCQLEGSKEAFRAWRLPASRLAQLVIDNLLLTPLATHLRRETIVCVRLPERSERARLL